MSEDNKHHDIVVNKFTEESAKHFRDKVLKRSALDPNMPIVVYVDSYGGNVDALNSMIATLHQVPNQIVTACIGKAMSCGAVLLAAGDHRFCDPMSRVLIHEVTGGTIDPVNEMENNVKETRRLNNQMMNFVAKRCGKSYRDIKKIMHDQDSRDINLTAKQALDFGIVDYIGTPIIKPLVMYAIETAPEHKYEKSTPVDLDEAISEVKKPKKKVKKKAARKAKTTKKVKRKTRKK